MATVPIQTASDPARQFQTASDPGSYSGFLNNSPAAIRIIVPDRQPVTGQIKAKTPGKPPIRSAVRSWRQYQDHRPPARQSVITGATVPIRISAAILPAAVRDFRTIPARQTVSGATMAAIQTATRQLYPFRRQSPPESPPDGQRPPQSIQTRPARQITGQRSRQPVSGQIMATVPAAVRHSATEKTNFRHCKHLIFHQLSDIFRRSGNTLKSVFRPEKMPFFSFRGLAFDPPRLYIAAVAKNRFAAAFFQGITSPGVTEKDILT